MNPLIKVNIPKLSERLETDLIQVAQGYQNFKYNNGTLGQKYYEKNDSIEEIESLKT